MSAAVTANTRTWTRWTFTPKTTKTGSISGPGSKTSGFGEPNWNEL
jgi:hypothetical protein